MSTNIWSGKDQNTVDVAASLRSQPTSEAWNSAPGNGHFFNFRKYESSTDRSYNLVCVWIMVYFFGKLGAAQKDKMLFIFHIYLLYVDRIAYCGMRYGC